MAAELVVKGRGDFSALSADLRRTEAQFAQYGRRAGEGFYRDASGRLRNARGQFVSAGEAAALGLTDGVEGGITRGSGRISRAMQKTLRLGAVAATAGAVAGVAFAKHIVSSASEAQQSLGATEAVFGKYADTVISRSEDAADALGLSANEYRELSNVTGAMLASAGTPLRKVADLTDDLNERAADMAATFGGTTREAVEAVSSLLRGETDPIERYGVAIKQSDINARLAAEGLDGLTGKSLKQAEQQARLELLFQQTASSAGQFADEADTLAGQQQRLSAEWDNLTASMGEKFLPIATDAVEWIRTDGIGTLEDWGQALSDAASGKDASGGTGSTILTNMVESAQDSLDGLADIWDGVEAGWTSMTDSVGNALDKHGPKIRQLADFAGATAAMFRDVLGPALSWVAENGLASLGTNFGIAMDALEVGGNVFFELSDIVLGTTGAIVETVTDMAGAVVNNFLMIAEAADAIPGIDMSGVVDELTGLRDGIEGFGDDFKASSDRVREGLREQQWEWNLTEAEAARLENRIRMLPDEVATDIRTPGVVESMADVRRLRRQYDLSPDEVVTVIEASGIPLTMKELRRVNRQYDLTPKQVATLVKQTGADTTVGDLRRVLKQADITSKKDVRMVLKTLGVDLSVKEFRKVEDEGKKLGKLEAEPKVKADPTDSFSIFGRISRDLSSIDNTHAYTYVHTIHTTERRGGRSTQAAYRQSLAETEQAYGTAAAYAEAAGRNVIARMLRGVTAGSSGVQSALEKVTKEIERQVNLKSDKKEAQRERAILKHLSAQYDALRKNGRAQDELNKKLEKARDRLQEIQQWAGAVQKTVMDTGRVVDLGQLEDGTVDSGLLLAQLRDRVNDAKRYQALLNELTDGVGPKLNDTALQQLLDAGPEAGLATAEALAVGGDAAVRELNKLTGELAATGRSMGRGLSDEFFKGGVSAAEQLVRGLEKDGRQLDRAAERMARRLQKALRRALRGGGSRNTAAGESLPALDVVDTRASSAPSTIRVRLTAEQMSRMERGREVQMDLDVFHASGGRGKAG